LAALSVGPDGRWLTEGNTETELILRAPASLVEERRLERESKWAHPAFSRDGGYVMLRGLKTHVIETTSGRICARLRSNRDVLVFGDIRQAVTVYEEYLKVQVSRWDLETGEFLGKQVLDFGDGKVMRTPSFEWPEHGKIPVQFRDGSGGPFNAIARLLSKLGLSAALLDRDRYTYAILDLPSNSLLSGIRLETESSLQVSPDGGTLAVSDKSGGSVQFWDVPPRKPLMWFAAWATLLALAIAFFARRRVGTLRAA